MSKSSLQTVIELKEKEIVQLKGSIKYKDIAFEKVKKMYLKYYNENYKLMEQVNALREENEILACEIQEYNTNYKKDMETPNNYEEWLNSKKADRLAEAYECLNYSSDDEEIEIEEKNKYNGLRIIK